MQPLETKHNLEASAQNNHLRGGIVLVSLALAVSLMPRHALAGLAAQVGLFAAFFAGSYGLQAGLFGVCGITALRGRRITEDGSRPVADARDLAAHRRVGIRVIASSVLFAACATALFTLL
jgi:hypothetical protein